MAGRKTRALALPVLLLLVAAFALSGCGKMGGQVLFSQVDGVLLDGGKPLAGARLHRSWHWQNNDTKGNDTTTTDAAGRFHFPEVTARSLLMSILPLEKLIHQTISLTTPAGERPIWDGFKRNYRPGGEIDLFNEQPGAAISVRCDLQAANRTTGGNAGPCEFLPPGQMGN
jgi:hypothetical protein